MVADGDPLDKLEQTRSDERRVFFFCVKLNLGEPINFKRALSTRC